MKKYFKMTFMFLLIQNMSAVRAQSRGFIKGDRNTYQGVFFPKTSGIGWLKGYSSRYQGTFVSDSTTHNGPKDFSGLHHADPHRTSHTESIAYPLKDLLSDDFTQLFHAQNGFYEKPQTKWDAVVSDGDFVIPLQTLQKMVFHNAPRDNLMESLNRWPEALSTHTPTDIEIIAYP